MTSLTPPVLFTSWLRPAPLVGVALCLAGYWVGAAFFLMEVFGPR
ncbi:hypothetical protein P2318_29680 [Myxococcaceae bacterium GXIMD 01537]